MKKLILILALLLISGVAVAGIFGGRSGVQTTPFLPSITAVSVTPNSFLAGSGDGTLVGAISVSASGATFAGTIAIGAGGQGGSFRLSSTTLPANLLLNGTQAAGTYTVNLVPTQAGLANSGNLFPVTITGTAVAAGCAQATTFLAGTSGLSQGQQDAYKAYICGLVADNVISAAASMASSGATPYCGTKLDALWIMATADATTANKDICGHTTYTLVPNGSPNFTANQGYLGVGGSSTVFLNTGFNPATAGGNFTQNSSHMSIWSLTNAQSPGGFNGVAMGSFDGGPATISQILPWYDDGKAYGGVNGNYSAGQANGAVSDSLGYYAISRTASTLETLYKGGASIGTNSAPSQSMLSLPIYILGRNDIGSGEAGAGLRIAMASVGAGVSSGDVAALQTRGCAYLTALNGTCAATQSIASIAPSSCSFPPNVRNGAVCALTVTMSPASPGSTAALSLTGTNSGLFHLVGTGCSNVSLGSCTIEQSSSTNGTDAGTYTDVSVVATQAGASNSPLPQALTLDGAAVPAPAAAAGFNQLIIDYDFTQASPWSNRNSWLKCHDGSGAANPLLYQDWAGFGAAPMARCSNISQANDPFGSPALHIIMDRASLNDFGCDPNCTNQIYWMTLQTTDSSGNGNRLPTNIYAEVTGLPKSSDPSMTYLFADFWSYSNNSSVEWDGIEWFGNNIGFATYHNNDSSNIQSTNESDSMDQSAYHKYAWRVTSNGSNDGYFCSYKDDAPAASSPGNCISWNPTGSQAANLNNGTVQFELGYAGCGAGGISCPNSSVEVWVRRLRVWSCAGINSGATCHSSSANP